VWSQSTSQVAPSALRKGGEEGNDSATFWRAENDRLRSWGRVWFVSRES
jgi:hypothetical protein